MYIYALITDINKGNNSKKLSRRDRMKKAIRNQLQRLYPELIFGNSTFCADVA